MKVDKTLFYVVSALISIGIVFSLSLSAFVTLALDYAHTHFFVRQLGVGIVGITLIWVLSRMSPEKYLNFIGFFLFFSMIFLMLAMPFMPTSLVESVNGASRWIKLPGFSFSPVEFFKIGFIYFLAWSFTRKIDGTTKKSLKQELVILLPYVVVFILVACVIAILQNDLGQVVVLGAVIILMAGLAGTSKKLISTSFFVLVAFFLILIFTSEHRIARVKSWLVGINEILASILPSNFISNYKFEGVTEAYQTSHSLNAIHNGGFFGQGLGQGNIKLGFLSDVHTDFVLAGIAEEVGILGIIVICALFYTILFRIFKIASRSQNKVHYLFCTGIGGMFFFSFLINSYGISGLTPVKGLAVPFLSYGGSHLLAACFSVGLVLMISKRSKF